VQPLKSCPDTNSVFPQPVKPNLLQFDTNQNSASKKPYQSFQIVDTPECSKTMLNAALTAIPKQTNRTLVIVSPDLPEALGGSFLFGGG
jgi:hypothetical protein